MTEIHFTVGLPEHLPNAEDFFTTLMSPTAAELGIDAVRVNAAPWERLLQVIQTKSIAKSGIDLSEVGTTWLGSLADGSSIRAFLDDEVAMIGGRETFTPSAYERSGARANGGALSIPWLTDTRVIYYWRPLLETVGLDGSEAFSTVESFQRTMESLKNAGIPPWGAVTFPCNNTVHQAASWIWAKGQDFVSKDGRRTAFCEPEALLGIREYFELYRYMPCSFDSFSDLHIAFSKKQVACVMDGPWLLNRLLKTESAGVVDDIGVALPPGPPFVGGSNLIIWRHVPEETAKAAVKLVSRLVSAEIQKLLGNVTGLLPVRAEVLQGPPYASDLRYRVLLEAEAKGRHLPRISVWGALEVSLVNAFSYIWKSVKERGFNDIDAVIRQHLEPLARRFDRLIGLF